MIMKYTMKLFDNPAKDSVCHDTHGDGRETDAGNGKILKF